MLDDEEITVENLTAAMALAAETELNIDTFHNFHDAKWKIHRNQFYYVGTSKLCCKHTSY